VFRSSAVGHAHGSPASDSDADDDVTAGPVLGEASPSLLIQREGETVDMFCEASAVPTPTLTWYKDGRELVSGDHVTIVGRRVRLLGLSAADGGLYTCTFSNVVGSISHHIKLVIQGQSAPTRTN